MRRCTVWGRRACRGTAILRSENSAVAVYHTYAAPKRRDWCVALRALNVECPVLRVPLEDRATYYMCGDFNATHHHAVLTGSSARFSSTHRVGVVAKDTWKYIKRDASTR